MPFVRTPVNIMRAVQDRSPLGLAENNLEMSSFLQIETFELQLMVNNLGASLFTWVVYLHTMVLQVVFQKTKIKKTKV